MRGKDLAPENIKKLLIIKTSSLGDIIHVLPCLQGMRELFPSARISLLIQKEYEGLVYRNPFVDECITVERLSVWGPLSLRKVLRVLYKLRNEKFDLVIDFQWLIRTGLIAFLTGAPIRFGLKNWKEPSYLFYNRKVFVDHENIHAVERNILFAKALGANINKVEFPLYIDETSKDRIKGLISGVDEYIVAAPTARWMTKRWSEESYADLFRKIGVPCVITGGEGDTNVAQKIMAIIQNPDYGTLPVNIIDICGKTDLKELVALISGAKAVVSNDSGPMHIAAALKKPVVALFGPTDPVKTGPYGWQKNKDLKVIRASLPCSPCFKKKCNDLICMKNISVEEVFDAIKEYL